LVAGVVGVRESLDEESIADLKLVVTEACTLFLYGPVEREPEQIPTEAQASSVRVEFHVAPEAWEITISDPEHGRRLADSGTGHPMTEGGLRLAIISALADSVEHSETDSEGSVIRLVKRFPSSVGTDV
jgi:anti-sigma regulatory factor (Ser/Thr protein kinase)